MYSWRVYLNFFGRSRGTEDIDILVGENGLDRIFNKINGWKILGLSKEDARRELESGRSVRIYKEHIIPNFEIKIPKKPWEIAAMKNKIKILLNEKYIIYFSPIELQIAYKICQGSDKNILDARFLYKLFEENLDEKRLTNFFILLGIDPKGAEKWLK